MFSWSSALPFCFGSPLLGLFPAQLLSPKLSLNLNEQKKAALSWHLETSSSFPVLPYYVLCWLLTSAGFPVTLTIKQQQQMTHRGPDWTRSTFLIQSWSQSSISTSNKSACVDRQEQTAGNNLGFRMTTRPFWCWVDSRQYHPRAGFYSIAQTEQAFILISELFAALSSESFSLSSPYLLAPEVLGICWHCCWATHVVVAQILLSLQDNRDVWRTQAGLTCLFVCRGCACASKNKMQAEKNTPCPLAMFSWQWSSTPLKLWIGKDNSWTILLWAPWPGVSAWDNPWKSLCGEDHGRSGNDQLAPAWSSSASDVLSKLEFAVWLFPPVQGSWFRVEMSWGCSPKSWLLAACLKKWILQSHAWYPSVCQFPPTNLSTCLII